MYLHTCFYGCIAIVFGSLCLWDAHAAISTKSLQLLVNAVFTGLVALAAIAELWLGPDVDAPIVLTPVGGR